MSLYKFCKVLQACTPEESNFLDGLISTANFESEPRALTYSFLEKQPYNEAATTARAAFDWVTEKHAEYRKLLKNGEKFSATKAEFQIIAHEEEWSVKEKGNFCMAYDSTGLAACYDNQAKALVFEAKDEQSKQLRLMQYTITVGEAL